MSEAIFKHGSRRQEDIRAIGIGAYIAELERDLKAALQTIAQLQAALRLAEITGPITFNLTEPRNYPFAKGLTGTELRLMGGLLSRYPRVADQYDLATIMLGDHAKETTLNNLKVVISKLRAKLGGKAAIENAWGVGYRLSEDFYEREIRPHLKQEPPAG